MHFTWRMITNSGFQEQRGFLVDVHVFFWGEITIEERSHNNYSKVLFPSFLVFLILNQHGEIGEIITCLWCKTTSSERLRNLPQLHSKVVIKLKCLLLPSLIVLSLPFWTTSFTSVDLKAAGWQESKAHK